MAAPLKPSLSVHEFLRYAIPGYVFLLTAFSPLIIPELYNLIFFDWEISIFDRWEIFLGLFLIAGFVIGYLLYYPYYWYFRTFRYTKAQRVSLKIADEKLGIDSSCYDVLSLHTLAYYGAPEKYKPSVDHCIFQFSVVHSIGMTILAMLLGSLLSIVITISSIPSNLNEMLPLMASWEIILISIVILLSLNLCREYDYRLKLATRIEDFIVMQRLDQVIEENKAWLDKFEPSSKQ